MKQLKNAANAVQKERLRCWRIKSEHDATKDSRVEDTHVLDHVRTTFKGGAAPVCDGGCSTSEYGACAWRGDSNSEKHCVCWKGAYGKNCELRKCPGIRMPTMTEGLKHWDSSEAKSHLFKATDQYACSNAGTCDSKTGVCPAECQRRPVMCQNPNQNAGTNATAVPGMPLGQKFTVEEASRMCLEHEKCLGFTFPGIHGYWDKGGVHKPIYDAKTRKGAVHFYSNVDLSGTELKEWGMSVYLKSQECADIKLVERPAKNAGKGARLVKGMPNGKFFKLETAIAKCQHDLNCMAFTFPSDSGYIDENGQDQSFFSESTMQGKVNFYSYPDTRELTGKESGMSMYVKSGPGTDWLTNDISWMTDSSSQRSAAGKISGHCRFDFETGSAQGWKPPQTLMCNGAFYGQPVSLAQCNHTAARSGLSDTGTHVEDISENWQLSNESFGINRNLYNDKDIKVTSIDGGDSAQLYGLAMIVGTDNDKTTASTINFKVSEPVYVIVLVDNAVAGDSGTPAWMGSDFDRLAATVTSSSAEQKFNVFKSKVKHRCIGVYN